MRIGIIGSGSWATALAKILTDNGNTINWWIRNTDTIELMKRKKHNPHYLSAVYFDPSQLLLTNDIKEVVNKSDILVIAVPSAFVLAALSALPKNAFDGKQIVSAIKGILPDTNELLNEYLLKEYSLPIENYFSVLGPCHAEEVAAEKLSYLTFSGVNESDAYKIARYFQTEYLNTVVNHDVRGVQYAAVLKNIYALGAGIAHGLDYGDNFLSVYIANSANEMTTFLKCLLPANKMGNPEINYNASVYLGDLLVTCYSLYSRNRTFGNMIGKGYSVKAAQLELNMVAEGYNASKCIVKTNEIVLAEIPIALTVFQILWEHLPASEGFKKIEKFLY